MGIHTLSLCSGIGAFDLGFKLALPAARTICYLERDARSIGILEARIADENLDDAPIWTDMRTFDGKPWRGTVDCIIGGLPCQPFSIASKNRQGESDGRSLWDDAKRIIAETQPTCCLFENVPDYLQMGFKEFSAELREMGFDVTAGVFGARAVGAPHLRKRLFVLAHTRSVAWGDIFGQAQCRQAKCEIPFDIEESGDPYLGREAFPPNITDSWEGIPTKFKPLVLGVADGDSHRVDRISSVGNAIVPLVVANAFNTLGNSTFTSQTTDAI